MYPRIKRRRQAAPDVAQQCCPDVSSMAVCKLLNEAHVSLNANMARDATVLMSDEPTCRSNAIPPAPIHYVLLDGRTNGQLTASRASPTSCLDGPNTPCDDDLAISADSDIPRFHGSCCPTVESYRHVCPSIYI